MSYNNSNQKQYSIINKGKIWLWIIICFVTISIPIMIYYYNFNINHISKLDATHQNWSAFGDFMSGTIGTLLALANLLIFIVLTYLLHKFQEKTEEHNVKAQQILVEYNMRNEAYNSFNKLLDSIYSIIIEASKEKDSTSTLGRIKVVEKQVDSFIDSNQNYLFTTLTDEVKTQLISTLEELRKTVDESLVLENPTQQAIDIAQEKIIKKLSDFSRIKANMIRVMQEEIIKKSDIKKKEN